MLRYTAFGGRDGGNSGKIGDRTKLDNAFVRGSGAVTNPRDHAFLFDIPIADCPRGECVSPIDWPQLFNAPCMVGEEWYYSTDEPMGPEGIRRSEEFFTATGLGRHPRWEQICTDQCCKPSHLSPKTIFSFSFFANHCPQSASIACSTKVWKEKNGHSTSKETPTLTSHTARRRTSPRGLDAIAIHLTSQ